MPPATQAAAESHGRVGPASCQKPLPPRFEPATAGRRPVSPCPPAARISAPAIEASPGQADGQAGRQRPGQHQRTGTARAEAEGALQIEHGDQVGAHEGSRHAEIDQNRRTQQWRLQQAKVEQRVGTSAPVTPVAAAQHAGQQRQEQATPAAAGRSQPGERHQQRGQRRRAEQQAAQVQALRRMLCLGSQRIARASTSSAGATLAKKIPRQDRLSTSQPPRAGATAGTISATSITRAVRPARADAGTFR